MRNKRIMIVEDESLVAKHIRKHLESEGYTVAAVVTTGEEAVERAVEILPDLILMDIRLDGQLDGIEAAEQIRSHQNVPVVYLTAFADAETVKRSTVTEPFGYLIKPFEPRLLLSTIEVTLYKHQMEKKLRASEARFRTLAESAPVGIFQADNYGECIYVNEKWTEISGIGAGESQGKGWLRGVHPQDRNGVSEAWFDMIGNGTPFAVEYRFLGSDDEETWVYGRAAELTGDAGNKIGYIGTINDISELKLLEEKLLTRRKLESLGILAGGIAHDFNNLLAVIMGNISLVKEEVRNNEDFYRMLGSAEKASDEAAQLAQKLITFSKGGWLLKRRLLLKNLLKSVIDQLEIKINAYFDTYLPTDVHPVNGDEGQLHQVFTNILVNAAEAVQENPPDNRTVNIKAENRVIKKGEDDQLSPGKYVLISVEDKGAGILPEDLSKIFDPYYSTKNIGPQKGMGLGLTICYSIVTKHGGSIRITSKHKQGSVVEVYLPAFKKEEAAVKTATTFSLKPKGRLIVVDDEENILVVTRQMLKKLGYKVETFTSPPDAIEEYRKAMLSGEPVEAIFLDLINKKGMGGEEAFRKLQLIDPEVKVVLISGYLNDSDIGDLKAKGFKEVLIKPFRYEELQEILDKAVKEG